MTWLQLFSDIFQQCIFPLLAILTAYAIRFISKKSNEIMANTDNAIADKYIQMISTTVTNCVIATNQTYTETLKAEGKFDKEAQKVAFEKTLDAVLNVLSEEAKTYITETSGDVVIYLTQMIEAEVNKNK